MTSTHTGTRPCRSPSRRQLTTPQHSPSCCITGTAGTWLSSSIGRLASITAWPSPTAMRCSRAPSSRSRASPERWIISTANAEGTVGARELRHARRRRRSGAARARVSRPPAGKRTALSCCGPQGAMMTEWRWQTPHALRWADSVWKACKRALIACELILEASAGPPHQYRRLVKRGATTRWWDAKRHGPTPGCGRSHRRHLRRPRRTGSQRLRPTPSSRLSAAQSASTPPASRRCTGTAEPGSGA